MTAGLIADIGATNARFALSEGGGRFHDVQVFACADYPSLTAAAQTYLKQVGAVPQRAIISIAGPVDGGDAVRMTNHAWAFSMRETQASLGLFNLKVVNDFTAIALAVPHLQAGQDFYQVGEGLRQSGAPIVIIGPGTGLGVGSIVFDAAGLPIIIPTEGGHATIPAQTAREFAIIEWLLAHKYSHVSAERVVSGKGIVNIYMALCGLAAIAPAYENPAEIMAAGLAGHCPRCVETVDLFCHWLGVVAGNLALSYGAFGGVYIAGGIVPQMGDVFAQSRFRDSFLAKGRYRDYLNRIATVVVTHPQPGLAGLAYQMGV